MTHPLATACDKIATLVATLKAEGEEISEEGRRHLRAELFMTLELVLGLLDPDALQRISDCVERELGEALSTEMIRSNTPGGYAQ